MDRADLYGECNVDGAPVDVFTAECCIRCINRKCTRSAYGKSKFEIRTSTWYERLFSNIPRMDPNDPNYDKISAQNFVSIKPTLTVNSWSDGDIILDLPEPVETKKEPRSEVFPEDIPKANIKPTPEPEPKLVEESLTEPPKPEPLREQKPQLSGNLASPNTPVRQGQMIRSQENKPKVDAWDAPVGPADTKDIRVVEPGAKIKLGKAV